MDKLSESMVAYLNEAQKKEKKNVSIPIIDYELFIRRVVELEYVLKRIEKRYKKIKDLLKSLDNVLNETEVTKK